MRTRIEDAMVKHIPWKRKRSKEGPKWMNNEIRKMIWKKRKAWHSWKRTRGMKERGFGKRHKENDKKQEK